MELLTVAAMLDAFHHQVFRGNEGQVLPHSLLYDFFVHMQTVGDVLRQPENSVGAEEALGHGDAPVGGIVQGAFQPLGGSGHGSVQRVRHQVAGQ